MRTQHVGRRAIILTRSKSIKFLEVQDINKTINEELIQLMDKYGIKVNEHDGN